MAALASQVVKEVGLTPAYAAATAGGDTVTPSVRGFLHVKNGGGSPCVVTIDDVGTPIPPGSASNPDIVVSVTNGQERMIGPIDPARFARSSDGQAAISYSQVVTVTVGYFLGP